MGPCRCLPFLSLSMVGFAATCRLLTSLHFLSLVAAFDISGRIKWNDICQGYQDIYGARVVLDDGRWSGYVRRDGRFTIPDVDPGTYIISVVSHDFYFDQLRIDVSTADPHASVHAYVPGTSLSLAPPVSFEYPLVLPARARNSYFVEREAFNPLDMLKSPMMLLMLVTGGMVFVMPYLMANMDKDTLNEVTGRHNKLLAAQTSLQNMDVGGLANLLGGESDNSQKPSKPAAPATPSKSRGKARKR